MNAPSPTANQLFALSQAASPVYNGLLANHLPMAVIAMQRMGATDAQLKRFVGHYLPILEFDAGPYGNHAAYLARLEQGSTAEVVADALWELADGVCASAFHAVIRVAYGLLIDQPRELSIGLAFLASEHQSLGTLPDAEDASVAFDDIIAEIQASDQLAKRSLAAPNIVVRLNKAAELPGFDQVRQQVAQSEPSLPVLARFARELYAASGDFSSLHAVTSCYAMRVIFEYLDAHLDRDTGPLKRRLLRHYALALAALYITIQTPDFGGGQRVGVDADSAGHEDTEAWKQVFAIALERDDDHDIKFAFTCFEEYRAYGHRAYLACAKQRLRLPE